MKILQVINSLNIGGAERLLVDSTLWLLREGNAVDVLLLNGVESSFKRILNENEIHVYSLGYKNNIYNPVLILKIMSYLKKYDLVHVHLFPAQYWVAIANLFLKKRVKLITTEHNTTNRRRKIWGFKWIDRFIYRCFDKVISISPQTENALVNYLKDDERVITIFNGINLQALMASLPYTKEELVGEGNCKIVIQIAGFRLQKDQDTVIKTLKNLPEDIHLILVGDGPRKAMCEKIALDFSVCNRVHFLGIRADVPRLLKTADVVVMSSHWEGFGLAAVEGMAAGKPVIASDVPGLAEVVQGAGILFKQGDSLGLAEILIHLLSDNNYYRKISDQCLNRSTQYDIKLMVDSYYTLYKSLLCGKK